MPRTIVDHAEIRQWVEAHAGNPMRADMPDGTGGTRPYLQLTFGQNSLNADGNEGPDRPFGLQLVSWDEWFEALDGQNLVIRVGDEDGEDTTDPDFEFVPKP